MAHSRIHKVVKELLKQQGECEWLDPHNSAKISRMIREALDSGMIKPENPTNNSKKLMKYLPHWA